MKNERTELLAIYDPAADDSSYDLRAYTHGTPPCNLCRYHSAHAYLITGRRGLRHLAGVVLCIRCLTAVGALSASLLTKKI